MGHLARMQTFFFFCDIDYPMISKLLSMFFLGKLVLRRRNTLGYFYSTFSDEWYMGQIVIFRKLEINLVTSL